VDGPRQKLLPVPLSPEIRTVAGVDDALAMAPKTSSMGATRRSGRNEPTESDIPGPDPPGGLKFTEGPLHGREKLVVRERLGEIIVGSGLDRLTALSTDGYP